MKNIVWLLLMGISSGSMAQTSSKAFGDINGASTDAHINIPGTKLYMIMPPGFKLMPGTTCYRGNEVDMILVFELPMPHDRALAKKSYEQKTYRPYPLQEIKVDGMDGEFYYGGENGSKSINLSFGDSTCSINIRATWLKADSITGIAIEKYDYGSVCRGSVHH